MVLAAGLGLRMRPLTDRMPKPLVAVGGAALIDHVLRQTGGGGRRDRRGQCALSCRSDRTPPRGETTLTGARTPAIIISDERAELLDTGGGIVKALPCLGEAPFYSLNADTLWIDGVKPNLVRLAEQFDAARMDALLLLAATADSIGYAGRGDFIMATRRPPAPPSGTGGCPIRLRRRRDPQPGPVRRSAGRPVFAQHPVRSGHRGRPAVWSAAGGRVDACRHARRGGGGRGRDHGKRGLTRVMDSAVFQPTLGMARRNGGGGDRRLIDLAQAAFLDDLLAASSDFWDGGSGTAACAI